MLRLFSWFILRRLRQEPLRSATTALGIALGVAVIVAIQLTNASSLAGFQTALETVSGKTSLEIVGAGAGVRIAWLMPNAGGHGYYAWSMPDSMIESLAALAPSGRATPWARPRTCSIRPLPSAWPCPTAMRGRILPVSL